MTLSLFDTPGAPPSHEELCDGAVVLRRFAVANEAAILSAVGGVTSKAPFRHMVTPYHDVLRQARTGSAVCDNLLV